MSDDRKNPGIKIPFLDISDKPIVEGTRCVEVRVPDDDAYMPVLAGLVAIATKWFNWQRDDLKRGTQIAKLWQLAYIETDWGSCMNCEELIACLEPVLDAQTADIVSQVTNNVLNLQQYNTTNPGQPMTPEQLETDLAAGTNPTCDYDIVWAQSLAVVQFTNRAITDLFEQVESAANAAELVEIFTDLPIVTWISEAFGVEFVEGLINYYQEAVQEGYLAQYTESVEQELACAVFCAARVDCTITVDLLYGIFYQRVQSIVPDDPADALELLLMLAGIAPTGTTVVDLTFWLAWGSAKLMTFFVDEAMVNLFTLQQLLSLAVNDANNDWELLCLDCPEIITVDMVALFARCGEGDLSHNDLNDGDTIELSSYAVSGFHVVSVSLANSDDWQIEVTAGTGWTALPSGSDAVYGWHDTADTFAFVPVSSGDTPMDFGTKDTHDAIFADWCATWGFNAAWLSATAFTITLRITKL